MLYYKKNNVYINAILEKKCILDWLNNYCHIDVLKVLMQYYKKKLYAFEID